MRYRSGLEKRTAQYLRKHKVKFEYETLKVKWQDLRIRTYTPDFVLPNGIIIETKGRFIPSDRVKQLMVKEQNPELDIRFVFTNPKARLSKLSKSTDGDWCDKHGFQYAKETIPLSWIKEKRS